LKSVNSVEYCHCACYSVIF